MILLDRFETLVEGFRHLLELSVLKTANMSKCETTKIDNTLSILLGLQREIQSGMGIDALRFKQMMFIIEGHIHRHFKTDSNQYSVLMRKISTIKKLEVPDEAK